MSFGVGASCGVALDLLLEQRLHAWPVVVDDRVPGRVANRIGQHHVLAEDPLERGSDAEECAADAQIPGVRLELDAHYAPAFEGVPQEQVLRLYVRTGSPLRTVEPRPADLGAAVERFDVQISRRADGLPADVDDERHLCLACERLVEPALEAQQIHARVAVDLRLAFGRFAQPFAVILRDRLDAHDSSLERLVWPQPVSASPRTWQRRRRWNPAIGPSTRHQTRRRRVPR